MFKSNIVPNYLNLHCTSANQSLYKTRKSNIQNNKISNTEEFHNYIHEEYTTI